MTRREERMMVKAAFPDYRGRKITSDFSGSCHIHDNYWDGGTRNYYTAVRIATLEAATARADNPFRHVMDGRVQVPAGYALLCRSYFCGKDCGITIYWPEVQAMPDRTQDLNRLQTTVRP
jgi:hypothetical protein